MYQLLSYRLCLYSATFFYTSHFKQPHCIYLLFLMITYLKAVFMRCCLQKPFNSMEWRLSLKHDSVVCG